MGTFVQNINSIIVTVISAVVTFIVGQILQAIWLEPLQRYKEIKSDIVWTLAYYANIYSHVAVWTNMSDSVRKSYEEAKEKLRNLSCEIRGFAETMSWIHMCIPSKKRLIRASDHLMSLSNALYGAEKSRAREIRGERNKQIAEKVYIELKIHKKKRVD